MRVDFGKAIAHVMETDPTAVFVTGDLGFGAFEELMARHPRRFINAGVAEQNMVGLAAGMALMGVRPWVYSIAPFATIRCLEQIRNDACFHDLPVRVVGNGGGYTYGIMGSTHHALEDLAVLKALPNMQLFFPCTNNHVAMAVSALREIPGPGYLRLGISGFARNDEPLSENPVSLTRKYRARNPNHPAVTVIGAGHGVQIALSLLAEHDNPEFNVDLYGLARYPFFTEQDAEVLGSVASTRRVVFLEEHYASGGIGESFRMQIGNVESFDLLAVHYDKMQRYGSSRYHLAQASLTPDTLRTLLQHRLSCA